MAHHAFEVGQKVRLQTHVHEYTITSRGYVASDNAMSSVPSYTLSGLTWIYPEAALRPAEQEYQVTTTGVTKVWATSAHEAVEKAKSWRFDSATHLARLLD